MRTTKLCRLIMAPIKFLMSCILLVNKRIVDRKFMDLKFVCFLCYMLFLMVLLLALNIRMIVTMKNKWLAIGFMKPSLLLCSLTAFVGLTLTFVTMWYILKGISEDRSSTIKYGMFLIKISLFLSGVAAGISIFHVFLATPNTENILLKTAASYKRDPSMAYQMDAIQQSLKCCGIRSYVDWYLGIDPNSGKDDYCKLPRSCSFSNEDYEFQMYKFDCLPLSANVTHRFKGNKNEYEYPRIYKVGCLWTAIKFMGDLTQSLLTLSALMFIIQIATLDDAQRAFKNALALDKVRIINM